MYPSLDEQRAAARRAGNLVTPGELAELMGEGTVEVAVVTYRFRPGTGPVKAPVDLVVRCEPDALEGVCRGIAKLCESRRWSSRKSVGRDRVPAADLGES